MLHRKEKISSFFFKFVVRWIHEQSEVMNSNYGVMYSSKNDPHKLNEIEEQQDHNMTDN